MKRKSRVLSLLLSAALVGTMAPTSGLTVAAAGGTSADGLTAADSIAADVDKVKFTRPRRSFLISRQRLQRERYGITMPEKTQRIFSF